MNFLHVLSCITYLGIFMDEKQIAWDFVWIYYEF